MGKHYTLVDDLDGSPADQTVLLTWKNTTYEIDLSDTNVKKLEEALDPYLSAGRKVPRVTPGARRKKSPLKPELDSIRYWASQHGYPIADKGRIPLDIVEAYGKAHG